MADEVGVSKPVALLRAVAPYWAIASLACGTFLTAVSGILQHLGSSLWLLCFTPGIVLNLVGTVGEAIEARHYKQLQQRVEDALEQRNAAFSGCESLLRAVGRQMLEEYGLNDSDTRVTFYGVGEKCFYPLGRYSANWGG